MPVQGFLTEEELDLSDPVIGIEFEAEQNRAVLYIDEGASATEIFLTYEQVCQVEHLVRETRRKMEWHQATWLYASEGLAQSTTHLMASMGYERLGKTLCGRLPTAFVRVLGGWRVEPVIGGKPTRHGLCKRCATLYEKKHRLVE